MYRQRKRPSGRNQVSLLEKIDVNTLEGKDDYVVAMDAVGAGEGEVVFFVGGSSSRQTDITSGKPSDATIIGIVDSFDVDGKVVYKKAGPESDTGKSVREPCYRRGKRRMDGARYLIVKQCDTKGKEGKGGLVALDPLEPQLEK